MLEMTAEEIDAALETGQTVVVKSTTLVMTTLEMAPLGKLAKALDTAADCVAAGQFVTVGAQEITVWT